ncbi:hypothetical protein UO65_4679 [Actinokineospora spheciospongiae]|uniref:Uncharacterized protein n=1 Tax=Actinokineospora spheciospongiae TaxID=909613 RepID=W7IUF8_9PSEU|nr:hypothetical protein UO65_4679 [Actinokineospora spheciospongiae]
MFNSGQTGSVGPIKVKRRLLDPVRLKIAHAARKADRERVEVSSHPATTGLGDPVRAGHAPVGTDEQTAIRRSAGDLREVTRPSVRLDGDDIRVFDENLEIENASEVFLGRPRPVESQRHSRCGVAPVHAHQVVHRTAGHNCHRPNEVRVFVGPNVFPC